MSIGAQLPQANVLVGLLDDITSRLNRGQLTIGQTLEELRKLQSRFDPLSTTIRTPTPYIPPQGEYAAPGPEPVRVSQATPNVVIEVNW